MVAGVAAHQHALLVVAADDGPMPQTLEHLAILRLLGVDRGVAAVTKVDCVERRSCRRRTQRRRGARTRIRTAPQRGRWHLLRQRHRSRRACANTSRRRAFTDAEIAAGTRISSRDRSRLRHQRVGVVVTGTVHSGSRREATNWRSRHAAVGARSIIARIGRAADRAVAGDRCAIDLGGISLDQVARGDWLVAPTTLAATHNIVVDLQVLDGLSAQRAALAAGARLSRRESRRRPRCAARIDAAWRRANRRWSNWYSRRRCTRSTAIDWCCATTRWNTPSAVAA